VYHALGFLPEPSKKEILLEEIKMNELEKMKINYFLKICFIGKLAQYFLGESFFDLKRCYTSST
jgi:hypothetical protein